MKFKETTKLFYDTYPYKFSFLNPLGHIFREKKFSFARDELDQLQLLYENNLPLTIGNFKKTTYDIDTFKECIMLYTKLSEFKEDYKIRIESPIIQIYSHNKRWLLNISKDLRYSQEFYEPRDVLIKNEIIVHTPIDYDYKVTLGTKTDPNLAKWIINNPKLAKAGPIFLKEVSHGSYTSGLYFYVRDERVLTVVNLMLGKTGRIDKIVYKPSLDK